MFCALVDDYDSIAESFPVDQRSFNLGGAPRPVADFHHRMVRAMALRKFVLARTDQVHVAKVVDALVECADGDETAVEIAAAYRNRLETVASMGRFGDGSGSLLHPNDLVTDFIYGGLLHGDYDRWLRASGRRGILTEMPLWQFTVDSEALVRGLRRAIQLGIDEGIISEARA